MRFKRWFMLLFLLAMIVAMVILSIKTYSLFGKGPEKTDKIRVLETERTLTALPHYLALTLGFYREQQLEVDSLLLKDMPEEVKPDARGEVWLCNLTQCLFTRPLGTGAELVAFAGLARKDGTFLLGREENSSFAWEQLRRKSILGDPPDDQCNILLEEILRKNNLFLQHQVIIIQNIPRDLKEGTFEAGLSDYVLMPEPMATRTEESGLGKKLTALNTSLDPVPSLVMAASPVYQKQHEREVQKLTNGLCKAMLWLDYHGSAEAARVIAPFFPEINQPTLVKMIQQYRDMGLWDQSPVIAKEDYELLQCFVRKAGELTNPVEYSRGSNMKFAQKAAGTVQYIPPEQQKEKSRWEKIKFYFQDLWAK